MLKTWKLIIVYLIILFLVFASFIIIYPFDGNFPDAITLAEGLTDTFIVIMLSLTKYA